MACHIIVTDTYITFVVDKQEEQIERKEKAKKKAKEKAMAATQVKLINNAGDDLMYGPTRSYAAPTLTGGEHCYLSFALPTHAYQR